MTGIMYPLFKQKRNIHLQNKHRLKKQNRTKQTQTHIHFNINTDVGICSVSRLARQLKIVLFLF